MYHFLGMARLLGAGRKSGGAAFQGHKGPGNSSSVGETAGAELHRSSRASKLGIDILCRHLIEFNHGIGAVNDKQTRKRCQDVRNLFSSVCRPAAGVSSPGSAALSQPLSTPL